MSTAVLNNAPNCYAKINASPVSLWDEEASDENCQQELIDSLSVFAVRYAYPELPTLVRSGRSNWTPETWDLPRLEAVHEAADLFTQRHRAYFALSHWAIMNGHPRVVVGNQTIGAGLTSWVAWEKGASLEDLCLALEAVTKEEGTAHAH